MKYKFLGDLLGGAIMLAIVTSFIAGMMFALTGCDNRELEKQEEEVEERLIRLPIEEMEKFGCKKN